MQGKEKMIVVSFFLEEPSGPRSYLTLENHIHTTELTLAPSRDEILPVKSQELQTLPSL